jgi:hypothetical protein
VTGHDRLGLAEALHGGIDLTELGQRLARAGEERGLRARVAFEVLRDRALEPRELLGSAGTADDRLELEERDAAARIGGERRGSAASAPR